jgi:hypothetical protein
MLKTLRITFLILFYGLSQSVIGQELIDQFGYSSTFCSGTYFLYSDSSFVYERGCEERSSITLGSFKVKNDTVILFPKRLNEIEFIIGVDYIKIDSSKTIRTTYDSYYQDSTVEAYAKYPILDTAELWDSGVILTDSLTDHFSVKFDTESWQNSREGNFKLASCPIELERLTEKRLYYGLTSETNEVRIHIALPYKLLIQMINYEMKYEEMQPGLFTQAKRIIKIEYH